MSESKFIQINATEDLTEAGVTYVTRYMGQLDAPAPDHLRQTVVDKIIDLSFRRLVTERDVPHTLEPSTSFITRDHFEITLGGRRCVFVSRLIRKKESVSEIHKDPSKLTENQIFQPVNQGDTRPRDEDIYIFAFMTGLVTRKHKDLQIAIEADQPTALVFPTPRNWVYPANWSGLGELILKGDTEEPVTITLGGLNGEKEFITKQIHLTPKERTSVGDEFYGLSYLHTDNLPDGRVGLHSPVMKDTLLITPYDWENLWVYGMNIYFVGYMSVGEFNRKSTRFEAGRYTGDLRVGNDTMAVQVNQLRPLTDLFVRANNWEQQKDR